jgi:pimeloyl-ACP methyl ester carboxylesterase
VDAVAVASIAGDTDRRASAEGEYRLAVHGRELNVLDLGSGPPVVFLHGLACCWQSWSCNLEPLLSSHRVVAPDLPGFGASELPRDEISIRRYAECVEELCSRLDLGPVVVVGHSMGGFVGVELALNYPERVDRLVLVSPAALWSETRRARPLAAFARLTEVAGAFFASRWEVAARRPRLRRLVLAPLVEHPGELAPEVSYQLMRGSGGQGFVPALQELAHYEIRERLPSIRQRTLMVWGAKDRLVSVGDADELESLIPHSETITFEDVGHFAMIERPEWFNEVLGRFLSEPSGSRAGA